MDLPPADSVLAKIDKMQQLLQELHQECVQQAQTSLPLLHYQIDSFPAFGQQLNERRKALGIELALLELQTGVSVSTLKRLFSDPAQVKFSTVHQVAKALGVTLCPVV